MPWCGMLYPDGTPVSYTEAAAFRSYLGHGDDFMYLNTWLEPSVAAAETYLTIASGSIWESGWKPAEQLSSSSSSGGGSNGGYAGALFEVAVWAISGDGALHIEAGGFNISLSVTKEPRNCTATNYLGCFQEGKRPGFVLPVFPINNARSTMTNKLCASLCKDANFKPYLNSGTERGKYIYILRSSIYIYIYYEKAPPHRRLVESVTRGPLITECHAIHVTGCRRTPSAVLLGRWRA